MRIATRFWAQVINTQLWVNACHPFLLFSLGLSPLWSPWLWMHWGWLCFWTCLKATWELKESVNAWSRQTPCDWARAVRAYPHSKEPLGSRRYCVERKQFFLEVYISVCFYSERKPQEWVRKLKWDIGRVKGKSKHMDYVLEEPTWG